LKTDGSPMELNYTNKIVNSEIFAMKKTYLLGSLISLCYVITNELKFLLFYFKRLFLLIIDRQASEKKSKLTNKLITTANFIVFMLRT
jgi:hypothetical protein